MGIFEFFITHWSWYLYATATTWGAAIIKSPTNTNSAMLGSLIITFLAWPLILLLLFTDD